ncbi:hypothetical protein [Novosphingobium terrae]|uniref:hypothetical protein n=1 Tax=Novosphingobium terrae TaxID=2726189 RepID=UPI0019801D30|nr:hypothetical protein [Novosphingobium terrae]
MMKDLKLTGGTFRVIPRAVKALNHEFVANYSTFDLGSSYATRLAGRKAVVPIHAASITKKRYCATSGSSIGTAGNPLTVYAGAHCAFNRSMAVSSSGGHATDIRRPSYAETP